MAKELSYRDWLQEKVKDLEFSLFGVADITEIREKFYLEEKTFSLFDKAISLGKRLFDPILDDIENQSTKLFSSFQSDFEDIL